MLQRNIDSKIISVELCTPIVSQYIPQSRTQQSRLLVRIVIIGTKTHSDGNSNEYDPCNHQQDEVGDGEDVAEQGKLSTALGLVVVTSSVVLLRLEGTDECRYQADEGWQVAMEKAQDHEYDSEDHVGLCTRASHMDHTLHLGLLVHHHHVRVALLLHGWWCCGIVRVEGWWWRLLVLGNLIVPWLLVVRGIIPAGSCFLLALVLICAE